jgi:alpha-1,2-mannosyltransferase
LFDADRMRVYPRIFVAIYLILIFAVALTSHDTMDRFGKPLGYDFMAFWSASRLTLDGHGTDVYDPAAISVAHRLAVPGNERIYPWHYPPTYQLLIAPLALLPYLLSYLAFVALTLGLYLAVNRRLLSLPNPTLLLLAFPGTFLCAFQGQNSLLTAALFGAAILFVSRRSVLAGVLLGLLAYKPQYGVLVPVALAAAGQWRTFTAAALTLVAFAAVSTAAFGVGLWYEFFADFARTQYVLEGGILPWEKMPGAFVFFRMLGLAQLPAYVLQILTSLASAGTVAYVWRCCGPTRLAGATLVSATVLLQMYVFDYEMALLAVPLAILASDYSVRGATPWERWSLLFGFVAPLLMWPVATLAHLQIGFIAVALVLFLSARRALVARTLGHAVPTG